jgi:hypothetical protein
VPPAASSSPTTAIKTEELSGFFEQTLAKAMGSQGTKPKPSGYMYNSNAQTQNVAQALLCIFCRTPGHFVSDCLLCQSYITNGKCKKNAEGKVVLLSGQYCPCSIPGRFIKDRINEWHKRNPTSKLDSKISASSTSSLMMYEILPIEKTNSSDFAAANMVSTTPINVFTADQCIAALEQEIFTLRSAKKNFDGVEILQPARKPAPKANKPTQNNTSKTPEGSKPSPKPKPTEPPKSTSAQPPSTPFH